MTVLAAVVPSVLSAVTLLIIQRFFARMDKKNDARAEAQRQENVLILSNLNAIGGLAEKTAVCVKNERVNGDMEAAIDYCKDQRHGLEDFLRRQAVDGMH